MQQKKYSSEEIELIDKNLKSTIKQLQETTDNFNKAEKISQCQQYQSQLEDHFMKHKFIKCPQTIVQYLRQNQEKISNFEEQLCQEGQDCVIEYNLLNLKQVILALKNEEYFQEIEKESMEKQADRISKQLELELKYTENHHLIQRALKYIEMFRTKSYLNSNTFDPQYQQEKIKKQKSNFTQFSSFFQTFVKQEESNSNNSLNDYDKLQYEEVDGFDEEEEDKYQKQIQQQSFQSTLSRQLSNELQQEKQEKITELYNEISQLNNIQQDIGILVNSGNEQLEQINKDLENTLETTQQANKELIEAYVSAQRNRRLKIKTFFVAIGGALGFGVGGGIGVAVGTAGGALIGKGVGRLVAGKQKTASEIEQNMQSEK